MRSLSGVHTGEFGRRGLILATSAALVMALPGPMKSSAQTTDTPRVKDSEEYSVYSAILSYEFAHTNVQQFVIKAETIGIKKPEEFDRVAPDVESDTLSDFKAKNEKSALLERRLDLKTPYVFVSNDELDAIFNPKISKIGILEDMGAGWRRFYERYPGAPGFIHFSRVGFDLKKEQALVYLAFEHDYMGGSTRILVLSKADKSWEVQKSRY